MRNGCVNTYYPASAAELGHGTNQRKYVCQSGGHAVLTDNVVETCNRITFGRRHENMCLCAICV